MPYLYINFDPKKFKNLKFKFAKKQVFIYLKQFIRPSSARVSHGQPPGCLQRTSTVVCFGRTRFARTKLSDLQSWCMQTSSDHRKSEYSVSPGDGVSPNIRNVGCQKVHQGSFPDQFFKVFSESRIAMQCPIRTGQECGSCRYVTDIDRARDVSEQLWYEIRY